MNMQADEGMARALEAEHLDWKLRAREAVLTLAYAGGEFTSRDVCLIAGRPEHPSAIGALMNAMARQGSIKRVAFAACDRHGAGRFSVWTGT